MSQNSALLSDNIKINGCPILKHGCPELPTCERAMELRPEEKEFKKELALWKETLAAQTPHH